MTSVVNLLEFLPPDIIHAIEQDVQGTVNTKSSEDIATNKVLFDFKMTNTSQDLKELTKKIKKSKRRNFAILLYGESGSGKSLYGKYLAQELNMSFIKKRASDLMDKFIGSTEKNIKDAFQEAKEKQAVLLLDECDSFLFDRKFAQRDFECTSVNEILTQMEDHPYPIILTTNLKDKLDPASIRRILFKIKYDYMTAENIKAGMKTYFGKKYKLTPEQLNELKYLTAGDFYIVKNKLEILESHTEYTSDLIYTYLLQEQKEKNIITSSKEITF